MLPAERTTPIVRVDPANLETRTIGVVRSSRPAITEPPGGRTLGQRKEWSC